MSGSASSPAPASGARPRRRADARQVVRAARAALRELHRAERARRDATRARFHGEISAAELDVIIRRHVRACERLAQMSDALRAAQKELNP